MYRRLDQLIIGATRKDPRRPVPPPVPSQGLVNAMIKRRGVIEALRKSNLEWVQIRGYFTKGGNAYGLTPSGWVQVLEVK